MKIYIHMSHPSLISSTNLISMIAGFLLVGSSMTYDIANTVVKGFKLLVHVNTRSLYPKLHEIEFNFNNFDVICILESWLTSSIPDSVIQISGYNCIRQDRSSIINKRGGGLCIYLKDHITHNLIAPLCDITSDYETVGLTMTIPNSKKITLT